MKLSMFLKNSKPALGAAGLSILTVLSSCSSPHTIIMNDGSTISTQGKPKVNRKTGFCEYTNLSGVEGQANKDHILRIEKSR